MSLIYNILFIIIFNILINLLSLSHIKVYLHEETEKTENQIKSINNNICIEIDNVKETYKKFEKTSKEENKKIHSNLKNIEEVKNNLKDIEEMKIELKSIEDVKKNLENLDQIKKNFEKESLKQNENTTYLRNKNLELEENVLKIERDNNEIKENINKNVKLPTNILSKMKNTNLIHFENNKMNINKIDTYIFLIKKQLESGKSLDVQEKLTYAYSKILNINAIITNNNNVKKVLSNSDIRIINNYFIIQDNNYNIEENDILNIYLHLIIDKYTFVS